MLTGNSNSDGDQTEKKTTREDSVEHTDLILRCPEDMQGQLN
jgi:hypothetical protein